MVRRESDVASLVVFCEGAALATGTRALRCAEAKRQKTGDEF